MKRQRLILSPLPAAMIAASWLALPATMLPARAQPSDAQIIKDLTSAGTLKVVLSARPGVRSWSRAHLQYFWERGATITRKADIPEYPNATLEVGGFARYTIAGGRFSYREFKVTSNEYFGIPKPTFADIEKLLRSNLPEFVGRNQFNNEIVSEVKNLKLADDPKWEWHNPNSVSVNVVGYFNRLAGGNKVENVAQVYRVRFYREQIKDSFNRFYSQKEDIKVLDIKEYSEDEIKAMRTLGQRSEDSSAQAALDGLPEIEVPAFKSDLELFTYTHKMLREASSKELEAYLLKTLAPHHFEEGRWPLMTPRGLEVLEKAIAAAHNGKVKYAGQYTADPVVKHYQNGMLEIYNEILPLQKTFSRMTAAQYGGKFIDGVKSAGEWKLNELNVASVSKPEHIEYLQSFSSQEKMAALHGNQRKLSSLTGQVQAAQQAAETRAEAAQAAAAIVWTPHTAANARMQVSFPEKPQEKTDAVSGFPRTTWDVKHPTALYRATAITFPSQLNRAGAQKAAQTMADALIKANGLTTKTKTEYSAGQYGLLYSLEKGEQIVKYRVWAEKDVLYELMMATSKSDYTSENEKAFFNSFQAR